MAFLPWYGVSVWNFQRDETAQHTSDPFERTFGFTGWPGRLQSLFRTGPKTASTCILQGALQLRNWQIDFMSEVYCISWLTFAYPCCNHPNFTLFHKWDYVCLKHCIYTLNQSILSAKLCFELCIPVDVNSTSFWTTSLQK